MGKRSGHTGKSKERKGPYVTKGNARYDRHDSYYRKARQEGYLARSVYKLEEIDRDFKLIGKAAAVLDLGCAPGSWMQYVERKVASVKGFVVGIDLLPMKVTFGSHVRIIQGDVFDVDPTAYLPQRAAAGERPLFDVVISDMAPNTTGIRSVDQARSHALCERAFDIAQQVLRQGGNFCIKVLEGGETPDLLRQLREAFDTVKVRRPKGTRPGSSETYIVALGLRQAAPDPQNEEAP